MVGRGNSQVRNLALNQMGVYTIRWMLTRHRQLHKDVMISTLSRPHALDIDSLCNCGSSLSGYRFRSALVGTGRMLRSTCRH